MNELVEKLYSYRVAAAISLTVVPLVFWFILSCTAQQYLFWPLFGFLFVLILGGIRLGRSHSSYVEEDFEPMPYRGALLVSTIVFLTAFVSVWRSMSCDEITHTAVVGFICVGIGFYRVFTQYKDIFELNTDR